jgi:DNA-binding transcriptional regulator LsrR (DeoR family)
VKEHDVDNVDHLRLVVKVARLYHTHGRRQSDIAARLQVSQSRVSRLLAQAEEAGIVRTVVTVRPEIHSELEEQVEQRYGLNEVHVFDAASADDAEFRRDLAHAMAAILEQTQLRAPTIGFTSCSRTLRQMVGALQPLRARTQRVVEMLGDVGPPDLQHAAARSTQVLAGLMDGEPVYLRTPGVVPTREFRELSLKRDGYAREALELLDDLDLALVGVGNCDIDPPLRTGMNYFTHEQLDEVRAAGAVGQVCLRFLDSDGHPVDTPLDDLVVGVTTNQLRSARRRWAVAGGPAKHLAIRAALRGGWVDSLITDVATARFLLSDSTDEASSESRPTAPKERTPISTGHSRRLQPAQRAS